MSNSKRPRPNRSSNKARSKHLQRKFYVRSGPIRWIVLANDVETAALRFVQKALHDSLISGPKSVNKNLELLDIPTLQRLAAKLDEKILISESGFSSSEAGIFVTSLVVKRWRNQIAALERLLRKTS